MHELARCVRFAVNPFLPEDAQGHNSYSAKPSADGLSLWLELEVSVAGPVKKISGFVINVVDIDNAVRKSAIPLFAKFIRENFKAQKHITVIQLSKLLQNSAKLLAENLAPCSLTKLSLRLNPYRKIQITNGENNMFYFSEKFEFAAMHKLWNPTLSDDENFKLFGKCANPAGHGHNYVLEPVIKRKSDQPFNIPDYQKIVKSNFIDLVDHKNLNQDIPHFKNINPTIENIAEFAWQKLANSFQSAKLSSIKVWETDKTCCSYTGPQ